MSIIIEYIPHITQRYDTIGDWFYDKAGNLFIMVSNDHAAALSRIEQEAIALHELTEAMLCYHAGVTEKQVDEFDFAWLSDGEPGEDESAPYHRQHMVANIVEKMYIHEATSYNLWDSKTAGWSVDEILDRFRRAVKGVRI